MYIETVKTDGLAHLSYLIGDQDEAVVIDPRRDTRVYEKLAGEHGCRIRAIFETHRNEDFITGSPTLAKRTGAKVYHGPNPAGEIAYAELIEQGFSMQIGRFKLEVLETPGHTDDSLEKLVELGDRHAFIAHKLSEHHYKPPYFELMEQRNLDGNAPVLQQELPALSFQQLERLDDCYWVDVRDVESFSGQHIRGSLSLPLSMIAAYAGWLLEPQDKLVLLATSGKKRV